MKPQKVDSLELANYILAIVGPTNHLKLQKLIYYVEAYHLAYFDQSLINDNFQAWLHGPVSRKIWDYYKGISNLYDHIKVNEKSKRVKTNFERKIIEEQRELINDVLREYGGESAYGLECMTHAEEPWKKARIGYSPDSKCEKIIDKNTMMKFYKQYIC